MLVTQLCPTFCDPMDHSPPGSSIYGILQGRILEWMPLTSPGDLPNPGIEPGPHTLWVDLPSKPLGKDRELVYSIWTLILSVSKYLEVTFPVWLFCARHHGKYLCKLMQLAFFFNFTILYWFCHISTWIRHRYTCVPHSEPSSLPVPSLWVVPVHHPQASSIVHRTWTGDLFHMWYYTCFNAILPNHPILSLLHRVQKTVLYISVSFSVSYTGLLLRYF